MEVLEYRRSETSTVRSELSTTSSGFAIVSAPIYKQRALSSIQSSRRDITEKMLKAKLNPIQIKSFKAPIPEYEPPPDYSPYSIRRHDSTDGHEVTRALLQHNSSLDKPSTKTGRYISTNSEDVTQSLLHQSSVLSDKSTSEITSTSDSRGKQLRIKTDNHELMVELYEPSSPASTSLSPISNTGLLPRNDQERKSQHDTKHPCSCSKKCLCVLVAILGTALCMTVIFVVLFFTVCINGRTKAC